MKNTNLTETKIDGETVFKGRLLDVRKDSVKLPDGNTAVREHIVHQGAVVVLPVSSKGTVFFVKQFRYPLGKEILELPAGKIDAGEDPFLTAKRELLEEIGGTSDDWSHAGGMFPCVGYSNERIEMYVAKDVFIGERTQGDDDEFINVVELTHAEISAALANGTIDDGKTMLMLYMSSRAFGWVFDAPGTPR